jgi:hypothetical protein
MSAYTNLCLRLRLANAIKSLFLSAGFPVDTKMNEVVGIPFPKNTKNTPRIESTNL